jgi:hypothetical protein
MIDLAKEQPLPLRIFARRLRDPLDYDTVHKWWRRGLLNRDTGKRVKLETVRLSTGRCTSMEAYWRFIERLNSFHDGGDE